MTTAPFKFDEIGDWSELKLEIVEDYGAAYTKAFANQKGLKKYYIDAFSGPGVHVSKRTGGQMEGSPARALKVSPPFDHFYFIDMDADKTRHLATLCAGRTDWTSDHFLGTHRRPFGTSRQTDQRAHCFTRVLPICSICQSRISAMRTARTRALTVFLFFRRAIVSSS